MTFYDRIRTIQRKNRSLLCVGLDPDAARIPVSLHHHHDPIVEFNKRIIDATKDIVCAYKINLAFYEALGSRGWDAIRRTLEVIPEGILTIGDAKRGDIGNTAELYARSLLVDLGFSASTVNPFMGTDSVEPFIRDETKGAFVLTLTSNPGAKDFQYLKVNEKPLYAHVLARIKRWNTKKNCGLVVGATRAADLRRIRTLAPEMPILIPGVGAQGGDLKSSVRYGCDKHGEMALINASRSVIYASSGTDFSDEARRAAQKLRSEINTLREMYFHGDAALP